MNDKLHDAMRAQADAAGFPPIDLEAVMVGGVRKVRRRRAAAGAGAVAGLAAAVALAVTLAVPDKVETAPDPALPFPTSARALGTLLVAGPRVIVAGQPDVVLEGTVVRLTRTLDDGFVYATDADDYDTKPAEVHAWRDGTTTDYGAGSDLAVDADGHVAAWIHPDADGTRLVVLDTRTLKTTETALEPTSGRKDRIRLRDVDGQKVYVHDGRGDVALNLVSGKSEPVDGVVVDVENDVIVVSVPDGSNDFGTSLYAETASGRVLLPGTQGGVLSPDGRLFLTPDAVPAPGQKAGPTADLIDTTTGERRTLDAAGAVPEKALAIEPTGWLDNDTVSLVWTADDLQTLRDKLLTCDLGSDTCEIAVADVQAVVGDADVYPIYSGMPTYERSFADN